MNREYRDEEKLREALKQHDWNLPDTAEYFGVSNQTINDWCERHEIPKKPYSVKENLVKYYIEEGMSAKETGEILYGSEHSVLDWLRRHDLPVEKSCKEKPPHYRTHQGYEVWSVTYQDSSFDVAVHRLACVAWFGLEEVKGKVVHHKNDISWDNREENLELLTNAQHSRMHSKEFEKDENGLWKAERAK